jgi:gliding motility-associated-like protein
VKKLATLLCLMAGACLCAFAQTNIDAMEYFFDSDPGLGNGVSIAISPGSTLDVDISINTSGLAVGFHTLVIRAKHQSGSWGVQDSRVVYVASEAAANTGTLAHIEYYFDSDPGPGNGTPVSLPTSFPTSVDLLTAISTYSLAPGFHVLHVRARDSDGNWSIPDARPFYIVPGNVDSQADIVEMEFFFDTEPGYGAGTPLAIASGTQIDVPALISSASLSNGFHTISIRAKDDNGQWGFAETRTFYVDQFTEISAIEYYIDTDPGEGSATSVAITPGGTIDIDIDIPTGSLTGGSHTLGVRAARTDGSWGVTSTSVFSVLESQTITFPTLPTATYGDAPLTLTGTSSSGLSLSYSSSDPLIATISGSTVTIVGAGTTTITASQPGDGTYAPAPDLPQTLVVNKASQTITFGALTGKTVGDPVFTLSATSSATLSVAYSSSNIAVATISGNAVTIVGAGTTNITASQSGNGNYNAATDVVQPLVVLPTDNPPSIGTPQGSAFYVNGPVVIHNTITLMDADDELVSATVSITSGFQGSEDVLLFTSQNGLAGTFDGTTGVLTISGTGSVANYQAALRSVEYENTATSPVTIDRTISIRVSDGTATSNAVIATITINKPPAVAAPPRETEAGGNIVFLVGQILSDPDDNLDLTTLKIVSTQGAFITIEGDVITISYRTLPDFEGTDELTVTICDLGGKCQTQIVTVDIGADVEIFNGISPNGDSMNDYFRIRFLPPGSGVVIFNRWGDAIYENEEYDSTDPAKRFEGNDNNGKELTTGTYYYVITLPGGEKRNGYLHLKQ